MFEGLIRHEDVAWAAALMGLGSEGFAPVDGDDSRLKALLTMDTVDFEACPGSGKTTLLVAKLAILSMRWKYRQQGICVVSHTNAARNEINAKLGQSAAGIALTRYPHFVGTIHSFMNEYLALPWLRSKGIEVRCIDTQVALTKRWGLLPRNLRYALEQAQLDEKCLIYDRPDYSGGRTGRFGPQTSTYQTLVKVRRTVSEQGYLCFDEMFVWANELLDRHPQTALDLRQRFPIVFVDEAQDNSEEQSALLHRIFRAGVAPSRRQRFGDSNQAIYTRPEVDRAVTDPFPGPVVHAIPRSYRFPQVIADEAKGLGVTPQRLIGVGPPTYLDAKAKAPVLFLFDDASVRSVLHCYGAHLVASFDEVALRRGVFTAIAGVHEMEQDNRVPRAMRHYAPNYDPGCVRKEALPSSFSQHLARARFEAAGSSNSDKLVNAAASALLAASEMAGSPQGWIARKSPHRRLVDLVAGTEAEGSYSAFQQIVLAHYGDFTTTFWEAEARSLAEVVIRRLSGTARLGADVSAFLAWPQASPPQVADPATPAKSDNLFEYPSDAPQVRIRLASIHSVKGETHTATLVLDSFFHDHHLSALKPWLLGAKVGGSTLTPRGKTVVERPRMLGRMKLHYVAMTRPTHLLCLAMRKDAFMDGETNLLANRGWSIIDCCRTE